MDLRFGAVHRELTLSKWMLGLLLGGVAALVLKAFFRKQAQPSAAPGHTWRRRANFVLRGSGLSPDS
jgi:hypothetical protein